MRLASVLLVAVLMTTCAISGTFAKYVSEGTATATAKVAKWSIMVEGQDIAVDNSTIAFDLAETWTDFDGSAEVDVAHKLLAPGTKGSFDFAIQNTAAVNVKYSITLTEALSAVPAGYNEADFPVEYSTDNAHWSADIADAVAAGAINMGDSATITVYWRWAFAGNDTTDTAFGVTAPTVTITATIVVEQVD